MSVFGGTFSTDLTALLAKIATDAAPYLLTVLGIVVGIIIVTFIFKFIKAHLAR
jgi:hypothetical protein